MVEPGLLLSDQDAVKPPDSLSITTAVGGFSPNPSGEREALLPGDGRPGWLLLTRKVVLTAGGALVGDCETPTTLLEFLPYQPCTEVLWTTVAVTGNAE